MMNPNLPNLSLEDQRILLDLARRSIENGLHFRRPLEVEPTQYSPALQAPWGAFVTLHLNSQLRGCIGTMEANHPLVVNVAQYACHAAFRDSRFDAVTWEEFPRLDIQISVLSRPEPMQFTDESDLLAQVRPGADGLVLQAGPYRGTFLPVVWEMLPAKEDFWRHLKRKAGLDPDYWGEDVQVSRYSTLCFPASAGG